jgi:hypothetical protein
MCERLFENLPEKARPTNKSVGEKRIRKGRE